MAKNILNETDLKNVIIGATVVGAGGGGSPSGGLDILELFKKNNPDKPVELELLDPNDMEDGAYAAVTAGMGAPRALLGKDFTPYAVNAYETLVEMYGPQAEICNPCRNRWIQHICSHADCSASRYSYR